MIAAEWENTNTQRPHHFTESIQERLMSKNRKQAEIHEKGSNATLILQCKVVYTCLLSSKPAGETVFVQRLCRDAVLLVGLVLMVAVVVTIVVQCDAVELEEWVRHLVSGRGQTTVQRHTLHLLSAADIDTFALLDISEIYSIDAAAGMGDDRRLHMSNKSPLRGTEEGMALDVGGTGPDAKSAVLVLD